jgi:hypothetical protein
MDSGGINAAGLAAATWTNAARTLTQGGGLFYGFPTLAIATVAGITLTAVATTSIATISAKQGIVLYIAFTTTISEGAGAMTSFIDLILDGNTLTIPIYTNATGFDSVGASLANFKSGGGAAANDAMNFFLGAGFLTSATVQFRVATSALSTGATTVSILWAHT